MAGRASPGLRRGPRHSGSTLGQLDVHPAIFSGAIRGASLVAVTVMGLLTAGIRYRPHARERGAPAGPRSWAVAGMAMKLRPRKPPERSPCEHPGHQPP